MTEAQRFPYVEIDPSLGAASALPYAPVTLELGGTAASVSALVDSGAALSVLPYDVGIQLGAIWEQQSIQVQLAGNLAESDARAAQLRPRQRHVVHGSRLIVTHATGRNQRPLTSSGTGDTGRSVGITIRW